MIAMKIQFRQKELEKFINWGIDNRSGRIGVIHDDDVTNVNRKTLHRVFRMNRMIQFPVNSYQLFRVQGS